MDGSWRGSERKGIDCRREDVVAGRGETLHVGQLDQPSRGAATRQHSDKIDRFGDERARYRYDGFLHKLLEPPQSADRRTRVDGADAARMTGAPGLQQVQRLGTAHLANRDAVRTKAQR